MVDTQPLYRRVQLGDFLKQKGVVSDDCLKKALFEQKQSGKRIGEVLVEKGCLDEKTLLAYLGLYYDLETVDLDSINIPSNVIEKIPYRVARRYRVIPFDEDGSALKVAMDNPNDPIVLDEIKFITGTTLIPYIATDGMVERALDRYYGSGTELEEIAKKVSGSEIGIIMEDDNEINIDDLEKKANEEPIIKLVNAIISKAIDSGASDIHIEPYDDEVKIRYRVDGKLRTIMSLHVSMKNKIVTRIKIMSKLNIAEKRLPQDGRVRIKANNKEIDIRVSVVPSIFGESVVMRILDKSSINMRLDVLGFEAKDLERYRSAIHRPYGIVLITGPTGAGKTTTLYASLNEIMSNEIKILTVEDPVEYSIKEITQVNVKENIGLTFPVVLRSFLRQDPDVILVGEIRDTETAGISIKSALTGHLVLSTLHTNDAPTAVDRLNEMGLERYLIASSLVAVVSQRLVRKVCPYCKKKVDVPMESVKTTGIYELVDNNVKNITVYQGKGCENCDYTGYKGREAVYEVMPVTERIRKAILQGGTAGEIRKIAIEEGMSTLRVNGLKKVLRGITTLDEVLSNTAVS